MTFAWREVLDVARELTSPTEHAAPLEARERSAISRAYYAAFRRAIQVFSNLGEYTPRRRGEDHQALPMMLKTDPEWRRRDIGKILFNLSAERTWADYEPVRPHRAMAASTALAQSSRALTLLDEIVKEGELL